MVTNSLPIPTAIHEFVANLSGNTSINQIYNVESVNQFVEFLTNKNNGFNYVTQKQAEAIALITKPYWQKEGKINFLVIEDTIYIYDADGIAISFVKPNQLATQITQDIPLISIDGVHAGTSVPKPVIDLINPEIDTDKPIYQANPYTLLRQSDVGVKELIGKLWQGNSAQEMVIPVIGTAFLWNLMICNGNRGMPSEEETTPESLQRRKIDNWLTTETYRHDFIYRDHQLPNQSIRNHIQQGHRFGIQVAGAVRSCLYILTETPPIIVEPHTYSGFSHPFLNKYLRQSQDNQDWIALAKQEESLRPLVSVLDVQKANQEGYWTTTVQEAEVFYQGFFQELKSQKHKLPPIDNIPESLNDVYGYGGGILQRLEQVVEEASKYAGVDYSVMKQFYQHNIFTVEINRLLIHLSEFKDVSSVSAEVYDQRCEIVGAALIAGIQLILPLIIKRIR